jgi:hypothetical protein
MFIPDKKWKNIENYFNNKTNGEILSILFEYFHSTPSYSLSNYIDCKILEEKKERGSLGFVKGDYLTK